MTLFPVKSQTAGSPLRTIFASLIGLTVILIVFWVFRHWLGRSETMPDVPGGRFECLSYTPSLGNNLPAGEDYTLPEGLIASDLARLREMTGCVRTYSSTSVNAQVVPEAHKAGLKVWLGIWIGRSEDDNQKEIAAALDLAERYPDTVSLIVVGNEVLLRREMEAPRLIAAIRSVKARTSLPVTYADVYDFWAQNPSLADEVDRVTIHILPYWEDERPVAVDQVQQRVRQMLGQTHALFPGKEIQIGEIGWPSAGRTRGEAVPSVVNQARFLREFAASSHDLGVHYNIIEGVDQPWKRSMEGTVGGAWGILDADRNAKFPLEGPVSQWPDFFRGGILTTVIMALALFSAGVLSARRKASAFPYISTVRWISLGFTGALAGTVLYLFGRQAVDFSFGLYGLAWGAFLMGLSMFATVILIWALSSKESLSPALSRVWRWAVFGSATYAALAMAMDSRYRDFVTLAYILPLLTIVIPGVLAKRSERTDPMRAPEGWMGAALLICAPLAVDSLGNREALAWAAMGLALGLLCWRSILSELSYFAALICKHKGRDNERDQ